MDWFTEQPPSPVYGTDTHGVVSLIEIGRAFSPGPSCKLSNQYLIQDHMAAHYKNLMSAKGRVVTVGKWSPVFDIGQEQLLQDKERAGPLRIISEDHFKNSVARFYCKKEYPKQCSACFVSDSCPQLWYYNPPPPKKIPPGRPSLQSADVTDEKKRELHRTMNYGFPVLKSHFLQDHNLKKSKDESQMQLVLLVSNCSILCWFHVPALEDVFQMHIKSKRHNLDEEDHKVFAQKNCGVKPPNDLAEVKGRWKTADLIHQNTVQLFTSSQGMEYGYSSTSPTTG
ncbi:spermatogenesis-associated protein 7-like protein [Columba guinea]|nr:spermatogenesis-associated protein 7-like protein [Columba guinea]